MSGGHFDYKQFEIQQIVDSIERAIENNSNPDETGFCHGFSEETIGRFREAAHTLARAAEMAVRVDWLLSGDDGEDSFHRRRKTEVRKAYKKSN